MSMNSHTRRKASEEVTDLLDLTQFTEALSPLKEMIEPNEVKTAWIDPKGRRQAPRFELKRTILVSNCFRAFRTQIDNISLSGVLLKDYLPEDFIGSSIDLVLIEDLGNNQRNYVNFRGHAVRMSPKSNRVIFEALAEDAVGKLSRMVSELVPL